MINRRTFSKGAVLAAIASPAIIGRAVADDEIRIASILDLSGGLDIYGKPTQMSMQMAVDEINDAGGLLGKKLKLITYDTQSNNQLYAQYAQQAALQDKVHVVHGGLTSASREVIRPILNRFKTLYVYSTTYEGGVCDRNTFCTGSTPAMDEKEPLKWAIKEYGKKIFSIGADYNSPRIRAEWTKRYAAENGATMTANEFFPLSVTEFGPIITRIQVEKPDFIACCLIGAAHLGFYRQWAAAGMLNKIPILGYSFGSGNEQQMLPPSDSEGIVAPFTYFMEIDSPENKAWVERYKKKFGANALPQNCISMGGYEGTMLWAAAVKKAGSAERQAVIEAMEGGASYTGPAGVLTVLGPLHHCARDIYLGRCEGGAFKILTKWDQQFPADAEGKCDLLKNPDTNNQFTPI
ncbi:ABC transporter substrate-binding protein [Mesorhizobium sp. SP-1A]|uniref:ABC transporter substrate-binding protein n=1 Tax=Mesorhizobium sp. SP-1A TaxID=3077840 RepID=UPI0028F721F8|nr:ABC transporter substrate-binding protein [Mesorhizobium sp. SP-1A]